MSLVAISLPIMNVKGLVQEASVDGWKKNVEIASVDEEVPLSRSHLLG